MKHVILKNGMLFLVLSAFVFGCKKDNDAGPPPPSPVTTREYTFDTNTALMFQDGETVEQLTSESRRYEIGKVLRVKAVDATTIEIANFAPVEITDATIMMTVEGQVKSVKLLKIKKIRAHAVTEIKYPFIDGDTKFLDKDDKAIDLAAYKPAGIAMDKVSFDFAGDTELIKKLKLLAKLKWTIKYHDFDPADDPGNNWKENPDAKDVRRFTGFILNMAYLYQADTTKTVFVAEPITNNDGIAMTVAQKEEAFQKMIDIPKFNCGIVVNVSGLGGGSTFGVANHVLHDYLTRDVCFIVVHEIGHMIGYSHSSTMTYPKDSHGAVVATGNVYRKMLEKGEFPVKTTNYYKTSDL